MDLVNDIHIALVYLFIDEYEEGKEFELPRETGNIFYLLRNVKGEFFETHIRVFWPELLRNLAEMPEFQHIVNKRKN